MALPAVGCLPLGALGIPDLPAGAHLGVFHVKRLVGAMGRPRLFAFRVKWPF
jgi:hypothetical protein